MKKLLYLSVFFLAITITLLCKGAMEYACLSFSASAYLFFLWVLVRINYRIELSEMEAEQLDHEREVVNRKPSPLIDRYSKHVINEILTEYDREAASISN